MSMKKLLSDLGFWILVAMALGCLAGSLLGDGATVLDPLGTLFIQLIKMLVVPLVAVSIVSGAISLGATRKAGKVAVTALSFILFTSLLAGALAVVAGVWFQPGSGVAAELVESYRGSGAESAGAPAGFWETIIGFIPANPIEALVSGNILQIILFCMLLGFGIGSVPEEKKQVITRVVDGLLDALIWCVRVVMWTAPVGVFALMASAIGTMGFELFGKLAALLSLDVVLVLVFGLLIYPLCVRFLSNVPVRKYFKAMLKPQAVAFSTSSSLATLAVNMETCEKQLGISKQTAGFVLPLGATINMTGNVIYYVLAALFFAQFYGMALSAGDCTMIVVAAVLSAVGQAGVPGPTLTLFAVFIAGGIPLDGIPLLFAVDRLFDMIRTVLNITGDACCAAVVDKVVAQ